MKKNIIIIGIIPFILSIIANLTFDLYKDILMRIGFASSLSRLGITICVFIAILIIIFLCFLTSSLVKAKNIEISKLVSFLKNQYNGLFYLGSEEEYQFNVMRKHKFLLLYLSFLERNKYYPVIYYNVTVKNFLNWIDYIYLNILNELNIKFKAKIVIVLHCDDSTRQEGHIIDSEKRRYKELYDCYTSYVRSLVKCAVILNETSFYTTLKGSIKNYPEHFFNIIISKLNYYIDKLYRREMDLEKFNRIESNLLSIYPIFSLAKKYRHLFALDYEGSFDIWNLSPFKEFKQYYNIYFIKCKKISGPRGERLPSWNVDDGINVTDQLANIERKLESTDDIIINAMYNYLCNNNANDVDLTTKKDSIKQKLVDINKSITQISEVQSW